VRQLLWTGRPSLICLTLALALAGGLGLRAEPKELKIKGARQAQQQAVPTAANPADVSSMDGIISALYDVISGPAGKKRDWNRFRSLFIAGARLIPTGPRRDGQIGARVLDPEGYVTGSGDYIEKNGFFEREVARRTDAFGSIAHVFSTYESRHKAEDPKPFSRGINSIQLMNDGKRWWIVTIFWDSERADNPIPEKYLKNSGQ
jgi:hypothetical protein